MIIDYINNEDRVLIRTFYNESTVPHIGDHVWLSDDEWKVVGVVFTPEGFVTAKIYMEKISDSNECFY